MRALNLGLFAVIGGIAGVAACADDPEPPEIVPGPNMPFPTGGAISTGGRISSGNSGSGSGGRSGTGGTAAKGCPTEEPNDGAACTLPTDGTTLKCVYQVTTTCTCRRSTFSGKVSWDCIESAGTGGRASGTGGKASTGGRAAFGAGGTTALSGGTAGKAGGFGFP